MPFGETFIVINLVACSERVRLSESAGVCLCVCVPGSLNSSMGETCMLA